MALLTIPDPDALILTGIRPDIPAQVTRSMWSRRGKSIGMPGAEIWRLTAAIDAMATEDQERPWRAFLFQLSPDNHFLFPVACQRHVGPKPLVNGAIGAGYSLPLDGMEPSTRVLSAGQYMTVPLPSGHHRLVMLKADLITNASGEATAQFNMALGEVPADNAEVETAYPFVPVISPEGPPNLPYDNAVSSAALTLEEDL